MKAPVTWLYLVQSENLEGMGGFPGKWKLPGGSRKREAAQTHCQEEGEKAANGKCEA